VDDLKDLFGSFGIIASDKRTSAPMIKLYLEGSTPKGDGVLTYEDPNAAHKSVEQFTGYVLKGSKLKVEMAAKSAQRFR